MSIPTPILKDKKPHPIRWKIERAVKWFFPCIYISEYETDGQREVVISRSWFGKVLWIRRWNII
jgi:hypothetical protein